MAGPYYVRSTDGSDADSGLTWALAKATLAGALAVAVAGERIWVSQVHAETQASAMTLTVAGTAAAPIEILCGNDAAQPPTAVAATAQISTTAASAITCNGFGYAYGLNFNVGTGVSAATFTFHSVATTGGIVFDNCGINLLTTSATSRIRLGVPASTTVDQSIILLDCTLRFSAAAQALQPGGRFHMRAGSVAATGTVPNTMILPLSNNPGAGQLRFTGVELSAITTTLVTVTLNQMLVLFEQCKVAGGVALTTGTNPGPGGPRVWLDHCDSGDAQYRMQRHSYDGDVYSETVVVRTGGASNGTVPLSHRMVSSANRTFTTPFYGVEMAFWNETTGSPVTLTVEILHDSVTNLKDNEIWLEGEYLDTSGSTLSRRASDRMANLIATPADQTDSSATWTTTGLTNPNTQSLDLTLTLQEIGWIRARVVMAKPSYTVYIDPLMTIQEAAAQSEHQYLMPGGPYVNTAAAAAGGGGGFRVAGRGGLAMGA